ncbi:hypothetical protein [Amycolatopsis sp. lyj-346]
MLKLARSELAQQDEYQMLDVFHQRVLDEILNPTDKTGQGR